MNISVNKMKKEVQEVEQKTNTWAENRHKLDKVVSLACTNFTDEGIIEEMFPEAKVIRLGEIEKDLHKKFMGNTKYTPRGVRRKKKSNNRGIMCYGCRPCFSYMRSIGQ